MISEELYNDICNEGEPLEYTNEGLKVGYNGCLYLIDELGVISYC